jgi:TPR repeat protein
MQDIEKLNRKIGDLELNLAKEKKAAAKVSSPKRQEPAVNINNLLIDAFKSYLGVNGIKLVYIGAVDLHKTYDLLSTASEKGSSDAKLLLARMYEKGEYVEKNFSKAFDLYKVCSEMGNSVASYKIGTFAEV